MDIKKGHHLASTFVAIIMSMKEIRLFNELLYDRGVPSSNSITRELLLSVNPSIQSSCFYIFIGILYQLSEILLSIPSSLVICLSGYHLINCMVWNCKI